MEIEHTVMTASIDSNEEMFELTWTSLVTNLMRLLSKIPTPPPLRPEDRGIWCKI